MFINYLQELSFNNFFKLRQSTVIHACKYRGSYYSKKLKMSDISGIRAAATDIRATLGAT